MTWIGNNCTGGEYFTSHSNSVAIEPNGTCFRAETDGTMCTYKTGPGSFTFFSDACWFIASFKFFMAHSPNISAGKCDFANGQLWNATFQGSDNRTSFVSMCFDETGMLTGSTSNLDGTTYVYHSVEPVTPQPSSFTIPADCNCPDVAPPTRSERYSKVSTRMRVGPFDTQYTK